MRDNPERFIESNTENSWLRYLNNVYSRCTWFIQTWALSFQVLFKDFSRTNHIFPRTRFPLNWTVLPVLLAFWVRFRPALARTQDVSSTVTTLTQCFSLVRSQCTYPAFVLRVTFPLVLKALALLPFWLHDTTKDDSQETSQDRLEIVVWYELLQYLTPGRHSS